MSEKLSVLKPFEPKRLDYSFRELEAMDSNGLLDFKLPIQRELKWQNTKARNDKSLLIFSILLNEPIGIMKCNYTNGIYHFVDGKQRNNTVFAYMRDEFDLKGLPLYQDPFTNETIDLNTMKFSELPKGLQEKITSLKPIIYFTDNASDAQQAYSFKATNNGMPLTNAEKARVEIKDQDTIVMLAQHELLDNVLSNANRVAKYDEQIVKHMWAIINMNDPCFLDKALTPVIQDVTFSQETIDRVVSIFDRLNSCYEFLKKRISKEKDKKLKVRQKRILRKIFKKVHIPTLSPVVEKSIQDSISEQQLAEWLWHFFSTPTGSSLSREYNEKTTGGSASAVAIRVRINETLKDYESFVNGVEYKSVNEPELTENEDGQEQLSLV